MATVQHCSGSSLFKIELPNGERLPSYVLLWYISTGEEAVLQYRVEDSVWDMHHTEVPPSQRGRGLGAVLAEVKYLSSDAMSSLVLCRQH